METNRYQNTFPVPKVMIVEDDSDLLDLIDYHLRLEAYEVVALRDGRGVVERIAREEPDLLLLDIGLSGENGIEICRQVRCFSSVPIIFITAYSREEDVVQGLAAGADDYVRKPFRINELLARASAQLRRKMTYIDGYQKATIRVGSLLINLEQQRVYWDDEDIPLTLNEFRLLAFFASHVNQVLPPERVLQALWGEEQRGASDLLRQSVRRLRQKIEYNPADPQFLITRPGQGYVLLDRSQ